LQLLSYLASVTHEPFSLLLEMSDIEKFFANKTVFVTGVTGFLGKVLVEKLLRSCGSIRCVYVLVRTKRDGKVEIDTKQ
jgi:FlaA1/EpsC-like NDP-sugar epimerase